MLVTGELWPSNRIISKEGANVLGETEMEGVEHLGQYVFEMTNSKVQQLRAERGLPEAMLVEAKMEDGVPVGYAGEELEDVLDEEKFEAEEDEDVDEVV